MSAGRAEHSSDGEESETMSGTVFDEIEDGFADDDLITPEVGEEMLACMDGGRNFVEREDFESELGSPGEDPFAPDYSSIAKYEILDVVGDDKAGRVIIVVYAYRLPSNKTFDHQKFLKYLMYTLDKYVDQDYTIVYFHYGLKSHNKPPMSWLKQAYLQLDRKYKKNLKALYLVHPTKFIKVLWTLFRPWISTKFQKKLHYVNYLHELKELVRFDQFSPPDDIFNHDQQLLQMMVKPMKSLNSSTSIGSNLAANQQTLTSQQFGVTIKHIMAENPTSEIPPIVEDILEYLTEEGIDTEGLFRRSANLKDVRQIQQQINIGRKVDFRSKGDVHLAAVLLKTFLRELSLPVIPHPYYDIILRIQDIPAEQEKTEACRNIIEELPIENYTLLQRIFQFLQQVIARSDLNLMNANNLAVVFGPNLTWPREGQVSLCHLQQLNSFCLRLLNKYDVIFVK